MNMQDFDLSGLTPEEAGAILRQLYDNFKAAFGLQLPPFEQWVEEILASATPTDGTPKA